jgi:branched-subunit amino acid transport protein
MLLQREFIRLEDNICGLINEDLEVNPQIKYFIAIVLAVAIMINTKNNQAVMPNTIEVFGQSP